jgi:hypothetical protein
MLVNSLISLQPEEAVSFPGWALHLHCWRRVHGPPPIQESGGASTLTKVSSFRDAAYDKTNPVNKPGLVTGKVGGPKSPPNGGGRQGMLPATAGGGEEVSSHRARHLASPRSDERQRRHVLKEWLRSADKERHANNSTSATLSSNRVKQLAAERPAEDARSPLSCLTFSARGRLATDHLRQFAKKSLQNILATLVLQNDGLFGPTFNLLGRGLHPPPWLQTRQWTTNETDHRRRAPGSVPPCLYG